jgi:hypothetical protein
MVLRAPSASLFSPTANSAFPQERLAAFSPRAKFPNHCYNVYLRIPRYPSQLLRFHYYLGSNGGARENCWWVLSALRITYTPPYELNQNASHPWHWTSSLANRACWPCSYQHVPDHAFCSHPPCVCGVFSSPSYIVSHFSGSPSYLWLFPFIFA